MSSFLLYEGLFTENEEVCKSISLQKLEKWIQEGYIEVYNVSIDYNDYGEYIFLESYIPAKDRYFTFYPKFGFNLISEEFQDSNRVAFYIGNYFGKKKKLDPTKVMNEVKKYRVSILKQIKPSEGRNEVSELFEELSAISDEDGAYTFIKDMGLF